MSKKYESFTIARYQNSPRAHDPSSYLVVTGDLVVTGVGPGGAWVGEEVIVSGNT